MRKGKPLSINDVEQIKMLLGKGLSVKEVASIKEISTQTVMRVRDEKQVLQIRQKETKKENTNTPDIPAPQTPAIEKKLDEIIMLLYKIIEAWR